MAAQWRSFWHIFMRNGPNGHGNPFTIDIYSQFGATGSDVKDAIAQWYPVHHESMELFLLNGR